MDEALSKNVCRTCLSTCNLLPIFPSRGGSSSRKHQQDISRATGLEISTHDGLPQTICNKCSTMIKTILQFHLECLLAEKKLLNRRHEINCLKPKEFESASTGIQFDYIDSNLDTNLVKESTNTDLTYNSDTDNELLDAETDLIYESVNNDTNKITASVPAIDSGLQEVRNLGNTIRKAHTKESTASEDLKKLRYVEKIKKCEEFSEGRLNVNGPNRCKVCKRVCKSLSSFAFHLRIHIGFNHVCEYCGKKFYAAIGLKRHCMSWHGVEKELSCVHCHHRSTSITRLKEHERTHTGEKPFECAKCGGRFHTRSSIIQHLRLHISGKTLQCDRCPSMFKNRRALTTHINQSHVRDYLYICYACDKRYSKNSTVRRHLVKVHGIDRERQGKIPRFSLSKCAVVN